MPATNKKAAQSPTRLTLNYFRKKGCVCQVVEQFIRIPGKGGFKRDLFGCIDVLAIAGPDTIGIQTTDHTHHGDRLTKSIGIPELKNWLNPESKRKFLVVSWKKKGNRWIARVSQISLIENNLVASNFYLK